MKESENDELNTGTVGFGLVGGGIAVGLAGALMLGLTHRPKSLYSMPNQTVSAAPLPGGGGALFTYSKRF